MSTRFAAVITAILSAVTAIFVVVVTDRPFIGGFATDERVTRAAVVVRDHVHPFQRWASEAFARSQLEPVYDDLSYLNLSDDVLSQAAFFFVFKKPADEREAQQTYSNYLQQTEDFTALQRELEKALDAHSRVDLFIFAHTNDYVMWLEALPRESFERLGLVYNTGCENGAQGEEWLTLGADTYIGHPGVSMSPVFATGFLRRWARGVPVSEALSSSNIELRQFLDITAPFCAYNADDVFARTAAILGGDSGISLR